MRAGTPLGGASDARQSLSGRPRRINASPRLGQSEGRTKPRSVENTRKRLVNEEARERSASKTQPIRPEAHKGLPARRQAGRGFVLPSEQSDHRNALSPAKQVSPRQRAAGRCGTESRTKPTCRAHGMLYVEAARCRQFSLQAGKSQSSEDTDRSSASPLPSVRDSRPCRFRSALFHALRPGPQSIRHCAGQRERQAGYQTKQHSGLVAGRAVGPAGAGDAPGNGRGLPTRRAQWERT
jgi:hypothetical protein